MSRHKDLSEAIRLITLVIPWGSLRAGDTLRSARALIDRHTGEPGEPEQEVITDPTPEIRAGAVVQLRSGGPAMTVHTLDADGRATCMWFGTHGDKQVVTFPAGVLEVLS